MLVLTRRPGESIVIDGKIHVRVVSVVGNKVRVSIEAPDDVVVDREEVSRRKEVETPEGTEAQPVGS
jgi:carbon storage regulator